MIFVIENNGYTLPDLFLGYKSFSWQPNRIQDKNRTMERMLKITSTHSQIERVRLDGASTSWLKEGTRTRAASRSNLGEKSLENTI